MHSPSSHERPIVIITDALLRPNMHSTKYRTRIVFCLLISLLADASSAQIIPSRLNSVQVICHGIPDTRILRNGDICNVDVSSLLNDFNGDLNETYVVGDVDEDSKHLIKVTHDCLQRAIDIVKPGVRYRDIGDVISKHAKQHGYSVVKTYCGHGIGKHLFHCAPSVPHYAKNKAVGIMKEGHVFTIEPMINAGTSGDLTWPDGWTAVTRDGKRSAQFEHTLLVTASGCEVLTARTADSPPLWWQM